MILRVAFLAASVLVRPERIPFRLGHGTLVSQRRKDHRSLCQPGHPAEQRSDRRRGRRNTCGNGKAFRGLALPTLGQRMQQACCVGRPGRSDRARPAAPANGRVQPGIVRSTVASGRPVRAHRLTASNRRDEGTSSTASASMVRASSAASRMASAALSPSARSSRASNSCRSQRIDRRRNSSASSSGSSAPPIRSPISGSPIAISRGRTSPPSLARTNASVTRSHCAIVWKQDSAAGQRLRIAAKRVDQSNGKSVGEAAVRRDRINERVVGTPAIKQPALSHAGGRAPWP